MKDLLLTKEGFEKLQKELDELKMVRRPAVITRIQAAKELGDLSENAEYDDARNEQSFVEGRIQELEGMVKRAKIVSKGNSGFVGMGSKVTVTTKQGKPVVFEIVGATESDPAQGKISNVSPIGKALMNHIVGDSVTVTTPGGDVLYKITKIE